MIKYLNTLTKEKGIKNSLKLDGLVTVQVANEFIARLDVSTQEKIRKNFILIDFKNGDILHFYKYIAKGIAKIVKADDLANLIKYVNTKNEIKNEINAI